MFVRAKDYDNYIVKVKIWIGKELGLENEKEAYIELKEIPTIETMQLKEMTSKGEIELLKYFKEMIPSIITDHNLYITEDTKMKNEEVAALLFEKNTLAMKVIGEYLEKTFFISAPKKEGKSKA